MYLRIAHKCRVHPYRIVETVQPCGTSHDSFGSIVVSVSIRHEFGNVIEPCCETVAAARRRLAELLVETCR